MKKLISIVVLNLSIFTVLLAQAENPTPEPITSIFDYDTCAPPCWMGIVPGESTSKDVERMFDNNQDLIDPGSINGGPAQLQSGKYAIDNNTGKINNGSYSFEVGEFSPLDEDELDLKSLIDFRDGYVDEIIIFPNETIALANVLESFGIPDIVRMDASENEFVRFVLIYLEPRLRVNLREYTETCYSSDLLQSISVTGVLYFSENAAMSPHPSSVDDSKTLLTDYWLLEERDVPPETWDSWLAKKVNMSCSDMWMELPTPEVTPPIAITPTSQSSKQ